MATSTATTTKQRRSSSIPWVKIPKLPLRLSSKKSSDLQEGPACTSSVRLLDLPSEVMMAITSYLDFADLRALRQSDRALDQLIAGDGSDLARFWLTDHLGHVPRHLNLPDPEGRYWHQVLEQTRRWQVSADLTTTLIRHVQYKTPLHHKVQRNMRHVPTAELVHTRLTPLLYTLSFFLSSIKSTLLTTTSTNPQSALDQATTHLISTTPIDTLIQLQYTWHFLLWLLTFILSRPTYAGTVERAVRGWTAEPLDRSSLARVLIFGNLPAVARMLELGDYIERKKWALQFLKSLNPEKAKWEEKWRGLDVGLDAVPGEGEARAALRAEVSTETLWSPAVGAMLRRQGGEDMEEIVGLRASNASTTVLLSRLAGEDLSVAEGLPGIDPRRMVRWSMLEGYGYTNG